MKRTFILTTAAVLTVAIHLTSCGHSRVWANKERRESVPPPSPSHPYNGPVYSATPLIISPTPGFTMNRHSNGQYFHRGPQGFLYWKGYDNRFYLDRNYINRIHYSKWEYNEWKRYSRYSNNNRHR